jgi:hypothetical protein
LFENTPQENAQNAETRKSSDFFALFSAFSCGNPRICRVPLRILDFGFRILPLMALSALALSTNRSKLPDKIPDLKPPLHEMPPTFWEAHATQVSIGVVLATVLGVLLARALLRRRGEEAEPADRLARRALEALRGRPDDAQTAAEAALQLRRFTQAVLRLPAGELTTEEVIASLLATSPRPIAPVPADVQDALARLLKECDACHFAPIPQGSRSGLVARALEIADRLGSLRPPDSAGSGVVAGSAGNSHA